LRVLSGGTRRKRRDRQRLTGNLEASFEHRSNLQVANKFSVEKSIEQYHREDNECQQVVKSFRYLLTDPPQFDILHPALGGDRMLDQLKRRKFITLLLGGAAAAFPSFVASAESPTKRPTVGFLAGGSKAANRKFYDSFPQGLQDLGYIEGRDYTSTAMPTATSPACLRWRKR
jgi:hypothetical protein